MGIGEEGAADLDAGVLHGGAVGVKEVLLGFPVGIAGVAGVVDAGQIGGGVVVGKGEALLIVSLDQLLAGSGRSSLCGQLLAAGKQRVDAGAGIGHLAEFHRRIRPFLKCLLHLTTFCGNSQRKPQKA